MNKILNIGLRTIYNFYKDTLASIPAIRFSGVVPPAWGEGLSSAKTTTFP